MAKKYIKSYTLDDGTVITPRQLAKKVDISYFRARRRLHASSDPKEVFADKSYQTKGRKPKTYILDDGSEWSGPQLAKHLNCAPSTAVGRLNASTDPARVLKPLEEQKRRLASAAAKKRTAKAKAKKEVPINKIIQGRMFYDGHDDWALIMRNT